MKELFSVLRRSIGPNCFSAIPIAKEIALALSVVLPHIIHNTCAKIIADALRNIVLIGYFERHSYADCDCDIKNTSNWPTSNADQQLYLYL